MEDKKGKIQQLSDKYGINTEKLKKEQITLSKQLIIKDSIDFSKIARIGGISNIFIQNKIISACVVIDENFEIIEQKYCTEKLRFPYIPGFRAYRELPAMVSCFSQLDAKPQAVFINGHGITHERLGLASHFSLATGMPTIGIADSLRIGEIKKEDIIRDGKKVGKVLQLKKGSRPLYVSPGNLISLNSAVNLAERFIREPHKLPEPLRVSHKYAKDVMHEVFSKPEQN